MNSQAFQQKQPMFPAKQGQKSKSAYRLIQKNLLAADSHALDLPDIQGHLKLHGQTNALRASVQAEGAVLTPDHLSVRHMHCGVLQDTQPNPVPLLQAPELHCQGQRGHCQPFQTPVPTVNPAGPAWVEGPHPGRL